jgi:hypothetical protein
LPGPARASLHADATPAVRRKTGTTSTGGGGGNEVRKQGARFRVKISETIAPAGD